MSRKLLALLGIPLTLVTLWGGYQPGIGQDILWGTAPLAAEDADEFTRRFGVPVLGSYAATEFAGGVAGWNLADYKEFWTRKRGSVGRAPLR